MIDRAFCHAWRLAITLLLLCTIATHALAPTGSDLDVDLDPAPFSAYDKDVVRTSLDPNRTDTKLKAIQEFGDGAAKAPVPFLPMDLPAIVGISAAASGPRSMWFCLLAVEAVRGGTAKSYFARGPPPA